MAGDNSDVQGHNFDQREKLNWEVAKWINHFNFVSHTKKAALHSFRIFWQVASVVFVS